MKINLRLIPLKIHFFLFQGCLSPILPFIILVAKQLGIPVSVQGTLTAIALLATVIGKPVIAAIADTIPSYRKAIFLVTLTFMVGCYSSIWFIPPLRDSPVLEGRIVRSSFSPEGFSSQVPPGSGWKCDEVEGGLTSPPPLMVVHQVGTCFVDLADDCIASCNGQETCIMNSSSLVNIGVRKIECNNMSSEMSSINAELWNSSSGAKDDALIYQLENVNISDDFIDQNLRLVCAHGEWSGEGCPSLWNHFGFWAYALLILVAQIDFNTGNSITDAIAVDSVGEHGNYGVQRAFGTLGWGLSGTLCGLLVDVWSGSSTIKNYSPAFLLCFIMGALDILVCAFSLRVPQIGEDHSDILRLVGPLLRQPRFFVSCCFVLLNGCFDGIVTNFLFVLQDEMAKGTSAMSYVTFIQGITLLVQCSVEAPFMFIYDWFMKKLGVQQVLSLVFFMYILRMVGLALVGFYGPLWSTLIVEILNGPCFGLGYTVTVAYAAAISPPGTSTTIQSILNICFDSFGDALANLIGGILIDLLGASSMFMIGGCIAAATFILHLLSLKFCPPPDGMVVMAEVAEPSKRPHETATGEELIALNINGELGSSRTESEKNLEPESNHTESGKNLELGINHTESGKKLEPGSNHTESGKNLKPGSNHTESGKKLEPGSNHTESGKKILKPESNYEETGNNVEPESKHEEPGKSPQEVNC